MQALRSCWHPVAFADAVSEQPYGAMLLERELLEAKIALLESGRPLAQRRSRR